MSKKSEGCTAPDCGRAVWAYGLCSGHRLQKERGEEFHELRPYRINSPHTCRIHKPGQTRCYNHCKCRCIPCRESNSRVRKRRPLKLRRVIDGTGTRRRLQALATLGWTAPMLSDVMGIHGRHLSDIRSGKVSTIEVKTAQKVALGYRQLCMKVPTSNTSNARGQIRAYARRNEWAGPLAWNNIDDPNEVPEDEGATRPEPVRPFPLDDIVALASSGENLVNIAQRVGVRPSAIEARLRRGGHANIANRLLRESRGSRAAVPAKGAA